MKGCVPRPPEVGGALGLKVLALDEKAELYQAAFVSHGAQLLGKDQAEELPVPQSPRRGSRPDDANGDQPTLICATILSKEKEAQIRQLCEAVTAYGATLVWVDSRNKRNAEEVRDKLQSLGFLTKTRAICGRSLKDQVWWKRWVTTACLHQEQPFPWVTADDEPCTDPMSGYTTEWLKDPGEHTSWEAGVLKLDSSMPYLGATKPKPVGTLIREKEGRALVWDPRRPLPGLHDGSWRTDRKDRLLLLGKGPNGPAARTLFPEEVIGLVKGNKGFSPNRDESGEEDPTKILEQAPRSLAELATRWASHQRSQKVGVCRLPWEEETQRILFRWLEENPRTLDPPFQVGGRKRNKNAELPENERAMKTLCYVLRHAAGTEECPMNEEGWVKWSDVLAHPSCQRYPERVLWDAVERDQKGRVVAARDDFGEWWVATWSGHTVNAVVGPAAVVPDEELPPVLVHGSYRRHTASIQKKGLLRKSRDLHFHDPNTQSEKWRLDLETRIDVDVRLARKHGCVFRKTGNEVWLCDKHVPVSAIIRIAPWDDLGKRGGDPAPSEARGSRDTEEEYNSAALQISRYHSGGWRPKFSPKGVTEEVHQTVQDIGNNLPDDLQGDLEVDVEDGTLRAVGPEARSAPGNEANEFECDWSASDSDVEVVVASRACGRDDEGVEREAKDEELLTPTAGEVKGEEVQAEDASLSTPAEPSGSAPAKGIEPLQAKGEETTEDPPASSRRRKIRFGSAHLHILKAAGEVLDQAFRESAQANFAEFKSILREEAKKEQEKKRRQPDSERRKKLKKLRRKEKKENSKDDAERDRNHAIAQPGARPAASFSPGVASAMLVAGVPRVAGESGAFTQEIEGALPIVFDMLAGALFDLVLMTVFLGTLLAVWSCVRWLLKGGGSADRDRADSPKGPKASRKVGGVRKRVRFVLPRGNKQPHTEAGTPFLGGPRAAKHRHPPGKTLRLTTVQGRQEYEQAELALLLSRYSQNTAANYQSQWKWWALFCQRRGKDAVRFVKAYSKEEEQLVLDFLVHCSTNESKAPGTIKLRLSAMRSMHLTLGYPDPLVHMPRVPLALAGLRRRFGTKERRMPVTPDMLKWLAEHFQYGRTQEASLLWGALTLGFFFLLRASEYLDVGYQDPNRGLRGSDVFASVVSCGVGNFWHLALRVRGFLRYLGYQISFERVTHISKEVDNDSSGYISFQELLKLIRRIRDAERESISALFEVLAEDGTRLHLKDLPHALSELKYFVTDEMEKHILQKLRLRGLDYVSQDDTVAFLNMYRDKDGLTPQERRELEEVFEQQCKVTSQRQFLQQLEDHPVSPKTNGSPKGSGERGSGQLLQMPVARCSRAGMKLILRWNMRNEAAAIIIHCMQWGNSDPDGFYLSQSCTALSWFASRLSDHDSI
eukprot:s2518_g6.t1